MFQTKANVKVLELDPYLNVELKQLGQCRLIRPPAVSKLWVSSVALHSTV